MKLLKPILAFTTLLVIIAATLIIIFCNTIALKPIIASQVLKYTGHPLTIDGDIHWAFFPTFSIHITHMKYGDGHDLGQFQSIEIANAKIGIKVVPFIYGEMELANLQASITTVAKNPYLCAQIELNTPVKINLHDKIYIFPHINVTLKTPQIKNPLTLSGELIADWRNKTLQWNDFAYQNEHLTLNGSLHAEQLFTTPSIQGQMNFKLDDLNPALQWLSRQMQVQKAHKVNGTIRFRAKEDAYSAMGKIHIQDFQAANVKAKNVSMNVYLENGVLNLAPMTAQAYNGEFSGLAKINFAPDNLQINMQGKFANISAALLWDDVVGVTKKINLTGQGDIAFQFTTKGKSAKNRLSNLRGKSQINLVNGQVLGIDLAYWINHAFVPINLANSIPDRVIFSRLTGSVTMNKGIIANNDLIMEMPELIAKGKGKIDFTRQSVEYVLHTTVKKVIFQQVGNVKLPAQDYVPIYIKGNLTSPDIYVTSNN